MTENGFNRSPTEALVTAPASKFPWAVSFGNVEVVYRSFCWGARNPSNTGDVARNARNWLRPVKYSATPGTFRSRDGVVPRQSPRTPSCRAMSRAVPRTNVEEGLGSTPRRGFWRWSGCWMRVLSRSTGKAQTRGSSARRGSRERNIHGWSIIVDANPERAP